MTKRRTRRAARPWKYANLISLVVTLAAAAGLIIGYLRGQVLWSIVLLLPAVAYEAYRTAGESTRWASWAMLILLLAAIILQAFGINYDLRKLFGETTVVAGQAVPLGDVKVVMPALLAVCALILFFRTRGRFTKYLAVVIIVAAVVIVYQVNPNLVGTLVTAIAQRYF